MYAMWEILVSVIVVMYIVPSSPFFHSLRRNDWKLLRLRSSIPSQESHASFIVGRGSDARLDEFLSQVIPGHSRSHFARVCDEKCVQVNYKCRRKAFKVKENDIVTIPSDCMDRVGRNPLICAKEVENSSPMHVPLNFLFEDEYMLAINKPAGMVVHPSPRERSGITFVDALWQHLGEEGVRKLEFDAGVDAGARGATSHQLGVVHRLDKGSTGVLVAAKTSAASLHLRSQFKNRTVRKTYLALCHGNPKCQTLNNFIGRDNGTGKFKLKRVMNEDDNDAYFDDGKERQQKGKHAVSHIKTIATMGKFSLCAIRIETGRTHQIRVHLSSICCPVIGDDGYCPAAVAAALTPSLSLPKNNNFNDDGYDPIEITRPLLHAYELVCGHPHDEMRRMEFVAPLPLDMRRVCSRMAHLVRSKAFSFSTNDDEAGVDPSMYLSSNQLGNVAFDKVFDQDGYLTSEVRNLLQWDDSWRSKPVC